MKVSAQVALRYGFFLALTTWGLASQAQMSAYPMGPGATPPPAGAPANTRPAYPGMAPGMSSQMAGQPKDLSNRFGLGVTNLGPKSSPALSLDWQTSRSASVQFNVGFDSMKDNNLMAVTGRFSRNMFIEENMHFFLFLGGGFSSGQVAGKGQSGIILEGGSGVKFFITGLPNLGWDVRFGLFYKSAGSSRMYATGVTGLHYYF